MSDGRHPQGSKVLAFPAGRADGSRFTMHDRLEICRWSDALRRRGCDRLVIHERMPSDPPEVGDYLSIYRAGQVWARCGVARQRTRILAWCSLTGEDIGPFDTLREALGAVLAIEPAAVPVPDWAAPVRLRPPGRVVTLACAE